MKACTEKDRDLIAAARNLLTTRYRADRQEIGAALRTSSGKLFCAVNLDTRVGRTAVCAEAVAVGMAIAAGDAAIEAIVAVNREGDVVSPCGACREMLADYAPAGRIIVPGNGAPEVVRTLDLLPRRYRKDGRLEPIAG
ncbi:MAG: cytidine deaminase [Pseudomonadota bacterium]|nr:cytidine deaminase [Pseudomonadota bacterium]